MEDLLLSRKQYDAILRRLDEINKDVSSIKHMPEPEGNYITNAELMALLHVSKSTLQRWRNRGWLPFIKIEKKLYYRTDDILNIFTVSSDARSEEGIQTSVAFLTKEFTLQKECDGCLLFAIMNS